VESGTGPESGARDSGRIDAGSGVCKRGIAANVAPGAAFSAGVGWWYNWASASNASTAGIEFVPWVDENAVNAMFPTGASFLLGFNEPNFKAQANLTAEQAATQWRTLQNNARAARMPLVSPAVNFCGPAANCNGTDPYAYLKAFFAACSDCRVDTWPCTGTIAICPRSATTSSRAGPSRASSNSAGPSGSPSSPAPSEATHPSRASKRTCAPPSRTSRATLTCFAIRGSAPTHSQREARQRRRLPTDLGRVYADLDGDCHQR